jgi:hypothetical protein
MWGSTRLAPAVIVHSLSDIEAVLAQGQPVTLLSAPGAAIYAGCLWWRALILRARATYPDRTLHDLLDCADASGHALVALRAGLRGLVLAREAPGWDRVAAIAAANGAVLLPIAPEALDMADIRASGKMPPSMPADARGGGQAMTARPSVSRLHDWLRAAPDPGDRGSSVG